MAALALALFVGALVAGVLHELRRQARRHHEFDHIDARRQVARALHTEKGSH